MSPPPQEVDRELADYFRRYAALVYRRALVLMGSKADAEDVVQEVFVRVAGNLDTFRKEAQISTWLYRITTNYCLTQLRNRKRQGALLSERYEGAVRFAGAPTAADGVALRELLAQAEPKAAQAAVYVYIDGMTRPEAAEALGVSLRSVGNLLNRFGQWAKAELTPTAPADSGQEKTSAGGKKSPSWVPDSPASGVNVTGGHHDDAS